MGVLCVSSFMKSISDFHGKLLGCGTVLLAPGLLSSGLCSSASVLRGAVTAVLGLVLLLGLM